MAQKGIYTVEEPYRIATAVAPSDATTYSPTDAIFVNAAGTVTVTMANGSNVAFTLAASQGLNISVTKVLDTGTDQTSVILLYR